MQQQRETPEERLERQFREVLRLPAGRAVLLYVLEISHYGVSAFAGDADTTLFVSGKQKVGEGVMQMINTASPEIFSLMIKEAKEEKENDARNSKQQPGTGSGAEQFGGDPAGSNG